MTSATELVEEVRVRRVWLCALIAPFAVLVGLFSHRHGVSLLRWWVTRFAVVDVREGDGEWKRDFDWAVID